MLSKFYNKNLVREQSTKSKSFQTLETSLDKRANRSALSAIPKVVKLDDSKVSLGYFGRGEWAVIAVLGLLATSGMCSLIGFGLIVFTIHQIATQVLGKKEYPVNY